MTKKRAAVREATSKGSDTERERRGRGDGRMGKEEIEREEQLE